MLKSLLRKTITTTLFFNDTFAQATRYTPYKTFTTALE